MKPSVRGININSYAPKVDVDNGISLHFYYRIADNLLKQASVYREEKNHIDLYIILLRFSSLLCETIPSHRDYNVLLPKERVAFRKKLLGVIGELESLKPLVQQQVDEMNRGHMALLDVQRSSPVTNKTSWKYNDCSSPPPLDNPRSSKSIIKPSFNLPQPREETLSRHSILGPNGLRSQWNAPVSTSKVQYPNNIDLLQVEMPSLELRGSFGTKPEKDEDTKPYSSNMESILSLDDGRWSQPSIKATAEDFLQLDIRQPSPPPVLAHVQTPHEVISVPPSKVADPRPGPAKTSMDGLANSKAFQYLHFPVKMMECFLRVAELNTAKNVETCGVLAGSLKNRVFCVTTLIIPKQEGTSDSCQTTKEEEIFDFQDKRSLFPLGWIHTHPSQSCFMSSVDLHTHYSYQIMLPEAIAIVMAPTDETRTHGIFHLSDPGGVSVIRNCKQRGFHPHEELSDGSPLYEHCSHVYMIPNMKFDVADLR